MKFFEKYLPALLLSIWPFFLIDDLGFNVFALIFINFWIGIFIGEEINKHENK